MKEARFPVPAMTELSPRQREIADKIASGPRGGIRGPFLALIRNPDLADAVQQLGEHLRFKSKLPLALIELAILLVARHWTCQYEWFAHERVARGTTDLPDAVIRAIQVGAVPDVMTNEQRIVYDFVVRTVHSGTPSDAVYEEAVAQFGREGVLDLIATCGYYTMIAMLLNTTQVPLPEGTASPLRERLSP
jgi:4-carboxymuconolactone decarboxylase